MRTQADSVKPQAASTGLPVQFCDFRPKRSGSRGTSGGSLFHPHSTTTKVRHHHSATAACLTSQSVTAWTHSMTMHTQFASDHANISLVDTNTREAGRTFVLHFTSNCSWRYPEGSVTPEASWEHRVPVRSRNLTSHVGAVGRRNALQTPRPMNKASISSPHISPTTKWSRPHDV